MKLFFALLVMAAAAAADDVANNGAQNYDVDNGDNGDANANGAQNYDVYNGDNGNANAERDSNFYRSGFVNPALNNPLYHNSAQSVLENLGDFKALYVKYENCAWAQYGQDYAERRGEDGEWDGGDDDGGTQILGCGAARGGDEHWYMGRTPCFRAQAAFSLYGIHKDHIGSIGSKCHHATFINSFFTTLGVEALAAPLGVDTTYGNSYCTVYPPSDGGITYDDDANAQEDHHDVMYNFEAFTSAGTGCQRNRFIKDTYGGAFCNGNEKLETTDTLDSFNKALENLDCVQIYDSSSGYYYENDGNQEDNQGAVDFTALDNSVEILKYSIACDVDQYPGSCPDPHGLLRKYSAKLKKALAKADRMNKKPGEIAMNALTGVLLFVSLLLGMTTIRKRRRMASKNDRKKNRKATPPPSSVDNAVVA